MKSRNWSSIIYDMVLTIIGTFGIISVPLTCILPEVSLWRTGFLSIVFSVLWVWIFYLKQSSRMMGIGLTVIGTLAFTWLERARIEQSMINAVQAYEEAARRESGMVLNIVGTGQHQVLDFHVSCLIVLVIGIAFLAALETVYLRSMVAAIALISPFLAAFITFSIIPGLVSFFFCAMYVFGSAARKRKADNPEAGYMILGMVTVLYLAVILVVPQKSFHRNEMFGAIYHKAESVIESFSGMFLGMNAPGGINYGQLGKVNEVKFSNDELASVTTMQTGRNQYFKTFTGRDYERDQWTSLKDDNGRVTEYFFNMMDASEKIQEYVTGYSGEEYFNHTKFFTYILKENNNENGVQDYGYSTENADYSRFQDIAEHKTWVDVTYSSRDDALMRPYAFGVYEQEYRTKAERDYVGMPDDIRQLMQELMGPVYVSSYNEKAAYIEQVKEFLGENYQYTVRPGRVPEDMDFLEYFLKESKQGYCTYFATAATMMMRYAGIPARYCEGYVLSDDQVKAGNPVTLEISRYQSDGNKKQSTGTAYEVNLTDHNAHAWVEVYMDGYGWLPIEVTPGASNRDSMTSVEGQDDQQVSAGSDESQEQETPAQTEEPSTPEETQTAPYQNQQTEPYEEESTAAHSFYFHIGRGIWITGGVLMGLLLAVLLLQHRKSRILRKRTYYMKGKSQKNPDEQIGGLYEYFVQLLKELGYQKPAGMDYEQYIEMLELRDEQLKSCQLSRLMALLLKARFFSSEELTVEEFAQIRQSLELLRALVYARNKGAKKIKIKYIDVL